MSSTADLHRAAEQEGLRFDQAEKDYVILRVLSAFTGVMTDPLKWVFKGGTCMRHCYYKQYRFSEDIDFSCAPGEAQSGGLEKRFDEIVRRVRHDSGMEMSVGRELKSEGEAQIEIPLHYSRVGTRRRALPAVRLHLTFDEPILSKPVWREVRPDYPDIPPFQIFAYGLPEMVAEKMRALLQQQEKWPRPRDLYDLWFVLCLKKERLSGEDVIELFHRKCGIRGIRPDAERLVSDSFREWNRQAWEKQLAPMMRQAPDYGTVWGDWVQWVSSFM